MSEAETPDQVKPADQARSKILRLPFAARQQFNRMLRDGWKRSALAAWLAEHGVAGVNPENIRKYSNSAEYQRWVREERDLEVEGQKTEWAMRLAESLGGSSISEKLKAVVAGKVYAIMDGIHDPDELRKTVGAVNTVIAAERLELDKRTAGQRDTALALEEKKFRLRFVEGFLQYFADQRAREIAGGESSNSEKIQRLGQLMFGDDWQ